MTPSAPGTPAWEVREGEALDLLLTLPPGQVDAVITDPPYSSGGTSTAERVEQTPSKKYVSSGAHVAGPDFVGDNRDQRSFILWSTLWLGAARRAARPGAIVVVFSDWRQLPATSDAVQAAGWVWRGILTWSKPPHCARPRKGAFRNQAEYAIWGTNGPLRPDPDAPCLPGVVQAASPRKIKRVHITQKPLDLMDTIVQVVPLGGLILDPFTGAGTTGVAAVRAGRRFLGFELVAYYAELAQARITAAHQQPTQP